MSDRTVEVTSVTVVPLVPPVRVTWYFTTPVSSVAASQLTTTEVLVAVAVTLVAAVGAWMSGSVAAQGSFAPVVTFWSFTVVVPVAMV